MPLPTTALRKIENCRAPAPQSIKIGEFYDCYDILLSSDRCPLREDWDVAKKLILQPNPKATLGPCSLVTRTCLTAAVKETQPNWPAIYLLTMLWGFGEVGGKPSKDGPAKLFVSTCTSEAGTKVSRTAALITAGDIEEAFNSSCTSGGINKLRQVGESFGTKFLFTAGLRLSETTLKPLVYDQRVRRSIIKLAKTAPDDDQDRAATLRWATMRNGADYTAYCRSINESASALGMSVYDIEQILFEKDGSFDDQLA